MSVKQRTYETVVVANHLPWGGWGGTDLSSI